jgi:hypothetical protein
MKGHWMAAIREHIRNILDISPDSPLWQIIQKFVYSHKSMCCSADPHAMSIARAYLFSTATQLLTNSVVRVQLGAAWSAHTRRQLQESVFFDS